MSYAEVTAKNSEQTLEEARAPPVPEIEPTEASTSSLIDVDSDKVSSVPSDFQSQEVKTQTQADRLQREADDKKLKAKEEAKSAKKAVKSKFNKGSDKVKSDPVTFGNGVLVAVLGTVLGVGAYRKYKAGEFDWTFGGIIVGAVGLFAGIDYFATSWLYKKYPPKN
jgi:hypothetical protein